MRPCKTRRRLSSLLVGCALVRCVAALKPMSEQSTVFSSELSGFCVKSNGSDENSGVVKLAGGDFETDVDKERCLRLCAQWEGDRPLTGCETIHSQSNRGCYAHTSTRITQGNGADRHGCWLVKAQFEAIDEYSEMCGKGCASPGVTCFKHGQSTTQACAERCEESPDCLGFQAPDPDNGFHGWCVTMDYRPDKATHNAPHHRCHVGQTSFARLPSALPTTSGDAAGASHPLQQPGAPDDWALCAREHSGVDCACDGGTVRYGDPRLGAWSETMVVLSPGETTKCSNGVFGDPVFGVRKVCECSLSRTWRDGAWGPSDRWACDASVNFVPSLSYSQITIDSRFSSGVTPMDEALATCRGECEARDGCRGFFYQQHMNTHQICGFFSDSPAGRDAAAHGHREGAVCAFDRPAESPAPVPTTASVPAPVPAPVPTTASDPGFVAPEGARAGAEHGRGREDGEGVGELPEWKLAAVGGVGFLAAAAVFCLGRACRRCCRARARKMQGGSHEPVPIAAYALPCNFVRSWGVAVPVEDAGKGGTLEGKGGTQALALGFSQKAGQAAGAVVAPVEAVSVPGPEEGVGRAVVIVGVPCLGDPDAEQGAGYAVV